MKASTFKTICKTAKVGSLQALANETVKSILEQDKDKDSVFLANYLETYLIMEYS